MLMLQKKTQPLHEIVSIPLRCWNPEQTEQKNIFVKLFITGDCILHQMKHCRPVKAQMVLNCYVIVALVLRVQGDLLNFLCRYYRPPVTVKHPHTVTAECMTGCHRSHGNHPHIRSHTENNVQNKGF